MNGEIPTLRLVCVFVSLRTKNDRKIATTFGLGISKVSIAWYFSDYLVPTIGTIDWL